MPFTSIKNVFAQAALASPDEFSQWLKAWRVAAESGSPEQISTVRDLFKKLSIPLYTVPGNHDYTPKNDRSAYEELMPKMINYTFDHKGWQFVGFDSTEGLRADKTNIQEPAVRFLGETLKKISKTQPTLAFTHFPLGEKVDKRPLNAESVLEMFKDHNLQATFGGHHHGFTERKFEQATLVTNRCCSFSQPNHDKTTEKGYFICEAKEGAIVRNFVEVPTTGI